MRRVIRTSGIAAAILLLAFAAQAADLPELTLAPRGVALRIAVAGDTGDGADRVAKGIRALHARAPLDAIVLTGDNFYPCGVTSERDPRWKLVTPITSIGIPVYPVLGNHDLCGKATAEAQIRGTGVIANWNFPARQYALRTPVADFAFIDTTPYARGRGDAAREAVQAILDKSTKRWRVVVGHHPVISSGYHGYLPRDEVKRMRHLLDGIRAELYICGHDHHLELIRGKRLFLVSGAGSDPIPPVKLRLSTVYPSEIHAREKIGFAVVEISNEWIDVSFYDEKGARYPFAFRQR